MQSSLPNAKETNLPGTTLQWLFSIEQMPMTIQWNLIVTKKEKWKIEKGKESNRILGVAQDIAATILLKQIINQWILWWKNVNSLVYLLSLIDTRFLNNWSSVEYNSTRSSCFWVAFPSWYACSTTGKKRKRVRNFIKQKGSMIDRPDSYQDVIKISCRWIN